MYVVVPTPGDYNEMSSILGDQQRPPIWAQMQGKGGGELRGLSQWVQLYAGAQINVRDLTAYLTYDLHRQTQSIDQR